MVSPPRWTCHKHLRREMASARDMTDNSLFLKVRSDIRSCKRIFPGAGTLSWFKVRKARRGDLQEDFRLAGSSEEAPSDTRMLHFTAKTWARFLASFVSSKPQSRHTGLKLKTGNIIYANRRAAAANASRSGTC